MNHAITLSEQQPRKCLPDHTRGTCDQYPSPNTECLWTFVHRDKYAQETTACRNKFASTRPIPRKEPYSFFSPNLHRT